MGAPLAHLTPRGQEVLYTVFGGPNTPREPGELEAQLAAMEAAGAPAHALERTRDELVESKEIWRLHALSA